MQDETLGNGKRKKRNLSDNKISMKIGDTLTYEHGRCDLLGYGGSALFMKETVDLDTSQCAKVRVDSDDQPRDKVTDAIASYYPCKNITGKPTYDCYPSGISGMLDILSTGKLPANLED